MKHVVDVEFVTDNEDGLWSKGMTGTVERLSLESKNGFHEVHIQEEGNSSIVIAGATDFAVTVNKEPVLRPEEKKGALDIQVGGGHYKDMAIQPVEFCFRNKLNNCQSAIVKYTCRYKSKNGLEDLKKARHYIDLLIAMEYGEE